MQDSARLSPVTLYWRKLAGCQRLYGTRETVRRVVKELRRPPASVRFGAMPDVSFVHARIAVGAAPREHQDRSSSGTGLQPTHIR